MDGRNKSGRDEMPDRLQMRPLALLLSPPKLKWCCSATSAVISALSIYSKTNPFASASRRGLPRGPSRARTPTILVNFAHSVQIGEAAGTGRTFRALALYGRVGRVSLGRQ